MTELQGLTNLPSDDEQRREVALQLAAKALGSGCHAEKYVEAATKFEQFIKGSEEDQDATGLARESMKGFFDGTDYNPTEIAGRLIERMRADGVLFRMKP